jgi:hypothetical protein
VGTGLHIGVDLYDEVVAGEFVLGGDFAVDHILYDGVSAVLADDFEGKFFALWGFDDVYVSAGALPYFSEDFVGNLTDLNLIV